MTKTDTVPATRADKKAEQIGNTYFCQDKTNYIGNGNGNVLCVVLTYG